MPYRVKLPPANGEPAGPKRPATLEEIFAAAAAKSRVPPLPPEQARAGLFALLDRWEALCEMPGMQVERHELADTILNIFQSYPTEAPGWQRAWKAMHRTANMEAER